MNFPPNPVLDQEHTIGAKSWKWNGYAWDLLAISDMQVQLAVNSASNADILATNAAASATIATTKASEASASATTASTKAGEASTSAGTASTKATEASTSATLAGNWATSLVNNFTGSGGKYGALKYANDAAASATAAATSATNAGTSETNALASKNAAATSASNAGTSETNANTAKTAAQTAQTASETAKTTSETARDLAQKWATQTNAEVVAGQGYGAKYYADLAATTLNSKAPLASPVLTGNPTAPTPALGDNDTSIATSGFVQGEFTARVDKSNGISGLTGFWHNLFNAAGTIKSMIASAATVSRTWTFPDKTGTVALTSDIADAVPFRNFVINGGCMVAQRGDAPIVAVGTAIFGGADRIPLSLFGFGAVSGNIGRRGAPGDYWQEFYGSGTGGNASNLAIFSTKLEAVNVAALNGKQVTFSALAYHDLPGNLEVRFEVMKPSAVDNFTSLTLLATSSVFIPSGSRQRGSVTLTLGATDASNGLLVQVVYAVGTGLTNKTLRVNEMQLNTGPLAAFEQRPYAYELAMCQRYYRRWAVSTGFLSIGAGFSFSANNAAITIPTGEMRPTNQPQLSYSNISCYNASGVQLPADAVVVGCGSGTLHVTATTAGGQSLGQGNHLSVGRNDGQPGFLAINMEL